MTRAGRSTLAVVLGTLAVLVGSMVGGASESNIADSFPNAGSYSANTGLQNWNGSWVEETDDGSPSAGNMRVMQSGNCDGSSCIRIAYSLLIDAQAIHRYADLAGAEQAILYVSLSRQGSLGAANVTVQATGSGTASKNFAVNSASPTVRSLDITDVANGNTRIRFETFGLGIGMEVFVDNVRIDLVYPDATTTTSTTTTTTLLPIPSTTLPTLPTTTLAPLPTTTSVPPSTSTTSRPASTTTQESSTTTLEDSETTTTSPAVVPSDTGQPPPEPATASQLDLARVSGVTLNLAPAAPADLGFSFGVNPVTGLTVNFSSVVEIIKAEFLSALGLGTMVAFFVVGGWKSEDEEDSEEEPRS